VADPGDPQRNGHDRAQDRDALRHALIVERPHRFERSMDLTWEVL
jgi:hypothetical protein